MYTINISSLLNPLAKTNAVSKYAKLDFEHCYSFLNVNEETGIKITASARQAQEKTGLSIN
jgi:hypothetical protein